MRHSTPRFERKWNRELDPALALDATKSAALLAGVVRALPDLQVETLDAFFHRIAAGCAFELELPPDWRIGDAATLARLRRQAIADLLEEDSNAAVELMRRLHKGDLRRSITQQVDALIVDLHHRWLESPSRAWDCIAVPTPPKPADLAAAWGQIEAAPVPLTAKGTENSFWRKAREAILEALDADEPERLAKNGLVRKDPRRGGDLPWQGDRAGVGRRARRTSRGRAPPRIEAPRRTESGKSRVDGESTTSANASGATKSASTTSAR